MNMGERVTSAMLKKLIENLTSVQKGSTYKIITQMKKSINKNLSMEFLQKSLNLMYSKFDDMWTENKKIQENIKTMKLENERLTKKLFDIEENDKQANIKLNQIENWMKGNNIEIQGVPGCENKNVEIVAMKVLKKVDPRIERHQVGKIRRLKTIDARSNQEKKEGKRMYNPILVTFKSQDQKLK